MLVCDFLLDFASHVSPQNQHNSWPKVVKNGLSLKPQLLLAYITYIRSSSCDYNVYCKYKYQCRILCVYQICNSISTYDSTHMYTSVSPLYFDTTLQVSSPLSNAPNKTGTKNSKSLKMNTWMATSSIFKSTTTR